MADNDLRLSVYEDKTANRSFAEVFDNDFVSIAGQALNFGFSSSAFWIKIQFDSDQYKDGILSSCYTQLDDLTLFIHKGGDWGSVRTGDTRIFASRDLRHPCFTFDLSNANQSTMYLRASSKGIIKLPLTLYERDQFWQQEQLRQLGYGAYFAFLLAMFIYNLFLFLVVRESAYLYYVLYLGNIALFLTYMSGHGAMYITANSPTLTDHAPVTLAAASIAFGLLFIRKMSRIDGYNPRLSYVMKITSVAGLLGVLSLLFSGHYAIILLGVYMFIALLMIAAAILVSAYRRWRPSYFLLSGILLMIPGGHIFFAKTIGWLDESWLTNNILHLTSVVEAMVLSFALAYRIRVLNDEIETHQHQAIVAQSNFSRSLLKAADYERRAIARELHDSFGHALLVLKDLARGLTQSERQQQIVSQLRGLISDTRNMARNMHPQQIESLGFSTALESMLTETIVPAGIKLKLMLDDVSGLIDKDSELHLYRIAQESVTNIVKHAQANEVEVFLRIENGCLTLMICDNGVGVGDATENGMGILNMTERAAIIGATFEMRERETVGTDIVVQVPVS